MIAEGAVERPQQVTRLSGNFEHEAIREAWRSRFSEAFYCRNDNLRILKREMLVIEEHLDGGRDVRRPAIVD